MKRNVFLQCVLGAALLALAFAKENGEVSVSSKGNEEDGAFNVITSYEAPLLKFTLTGKHPKVSSVDFTFTVGERAYKEPGLQTSEGWQYQTRDISVTNGDEILASAIAYDSDGNRLFETREDVMLYGEKRPVVHHLSKRATYVVFLDDFNTFSSDNWKTETSMFGGLNWEFQVYTNDQRNVFVNDGYLYLQPTLTIDDPRFDENFLTQGTMDIPALYGCCTHAGNWGCFREGKNGILPTVMSGKVTSRPVLKYGIVEVRARIPKGDWLWPAIWLMPEHNVYGEWPKSGEIDMMESRGNNGTIGVGHVMSTLHWGHEMGNDRWQTTTAKKFADDWSEKFHTYKLVWTPDMIAMYVDNDEIYQIKPTDGGFWEKGNFASGRENMWSSGTKMAPFDQEFHLNLNVAVGTSLGFFPEDPTGTLYDHPKPWKNHDTQSAVQFWSAKDQWYPTWRPETRKAAMTVNWVRFSTL